jgi:hypothetical protein
VTGDLEPRALQLVALQSLREDLGVRAGLFRQFGRTQPEVDQ